MSYIDIQHREPDTWWYEAPKPKRWHRCEAWTYGWHVLTYVERCACGGTRLDRRGPWIERNSRRCET